jgi:hypothetical protein
VVSAAAEEEATEGEELMFAYPQVVQQWNIAPGFEHLPYTVVRSHNITRYMDQSVAAMAQYLADMQASLARTTPFDAPPFIPMHFVRRAFTQGGGSNEGELQAISRIYSPGPDDPRRLGEQLATPPYYAAPATEVGTRSGANVVPQRRQRHPRGWPTILPLHDRVAPPGALYDGSTQAVAMAHLEKQMRTSLGPMMSMVNRFSARAVGGK